jgi:alpha-1,3-mannosyltransferase
VSANKYTPQYNSLGVSIKMNILLFAPGMLLLLFLRFGVLGSIPKLMICAAIQLILGAPFLHHHAWAYIKMSFDLGK